MIDSEGSNGFVTIKSDGEKGFVTIDSGDEANGIATSLGGAICTWPRTRERPSVIRHWYSRSSSMDSGYSNAELLSLRSCFAITQQA